MALTIEIAGVDRTEFWRRGSSTWELVNNGRGGCNAEFVVPVGHAFRPVDGMTVEIFEGATVRFGGILLEPSEKEIGDRDDNAFVEFDCQASDYNLLADRRIVSATYENTAFETIVADIVTTYMSGEGITITGVESGAALTKLVFNYVTVTEAFNILSDATGKAWWIDETKDLNFKATTSEAAPADLDGDNTLAGTVKVRSDRQKYRNSQIVRAGTPEFSIIAQETDDTEIAARAALENTSGIYEKVTDAQEVTDGTVALELAEDLIERFALVTKIIECKTRTAGYLAGQAVTVDFPNHDINSQAAFIDSVKAEVVDELEEIWYTVRAITGDPFGGWMEHFRKNQPPRFPLEFETPAPGAWQIDATPGVLIHDPPPADVEWFQGPASGALDSTGSAFGITDQGDFLISMRRGGSAGSGGCPGGEFPGCAGVCHASARQLIVEKFAIDPTTRAVATTPSACGSCDVFGPGTNIKQQVYISPDGTKCAFVVTNTPSVDSRFIVFNISGTPSLLGSVVTSILTNSNTSEGVWSADDRVYFVDGSANLYTFDVSTPSAPVEIDVLATSIAGLRCLVFSPDESVMYGCGADPQGVGFDLADPDNPVEGTLVNIGISPESWDINDDGTALVCFKRANSSFVSWATLDVALNTTTVTANSSGSIALATTNMDGLACIFRGTTAVVYDDQNVGSPANSLKAYRFDVSDLTAPTLAETFSWNHGISGSKGPIKSRAAAMSGYVFAFGTDAQLLYAAELFNSIVPITIDNPLRAGWGGTGLTEYDIGDIVFASGVVPIDGRGHGALERLAIGDDGQHLIASGGVPLWADEAAPTDAELVRFQSAELQVFSGVLTEITELAVPVDVGEYLFRAELFIEPDADLGHQYAMGGTAEGSTRFQVRTTDDDTGECSMLVSGQLAALYPADPTAVVGASGTVRGFTEIMGTIDITASGMLVPMFATVHDP